MDLFDHEPLAHVRQSGEWDCGVACAARLAGIAYEAEAAISSPIAGDLEGFGMSNATFASVLEATTRSPWSVSRKRPQPILLDFAARCDLGEPFSLSIREKETGPCHVIVIAGGVIHDPALARPRPTMASYGKRRWWVQAVFRRRPR